MAKFGRAALQTLQARSNAAAAEGLPMRSARAIDAVWHSSRRRSPANACSRRDTAGSAAGLDHQEWQKRPPAVQRHNQQAEIDQPCAPPQGVCRACRSTGPCSKPHPPRFEPAGGAADQASKPAVSAAHTPSAPHAAQQSGVPVPGTVSAARQAKGLAAEVLAIGPRAEMVDGLLDGKRSRSRLPPQAPWPADRIGPQPQASRNPEASAPGPCRSCTHSKIKQDVALIRRVAHPRKEGRIAGVYPPSPCRGSASRQLTRGHWLRPSASKASKSLRVVVRKEAESFHIGSKPWLGSGLTWRSPPPMCGVKLAVGREG